MNQPDERDLTRAQPQPARHHRAYRRLGGYIAPALIVAAVLIGARWAESEFDAPPWIFPLALVFAFLVCVKLTAVWWNDLDEVAKEAHLHSFLWGGSAGMGISLIALVAATNYSSAIGLEVMEPSEAFVAGFLCLALPMGVGYFIWWAMWWLRRR